MAVREDEQGWDFLWSLRIYNLSQRIDNLEDIRPEPEDRQPSCRQPVIELVPDVPGPRRSTRVRRPTMHYGDPVEIPEMKISLVEKAVRGHTLVKGGVM